MKIKHISAYSTRDPFFLYLDPALTEKIIHGGANKLLLPLPSQPKPIPQAGSSRIRPLDVGRYAEQAKDFVRFSSGEIEIRKKFMLPCARDTVFLCKENHMLFYADEHGCVTDGRCGTKCMEENGRKFCVLYMNDIVDNVGNIRTEYGQYQEEMERILGTMPKRNPIMMRRQYARLHIIPHTSYIRKLGFACQSVHKGSGFDTKEDYLSVWDSVYRITDPRSCKLHSSQYPWVQDIRFSVDINWDKAWNPYGYLAMQQNIRKDMHI